MPPAGILIRNPMGSAFFMSPYRRQNFTPAGKAGLSVHCISEGWTIDGLCSLLSGSAAKDVAVKTASKMANINVSSAAALMMLFLFSRVVVFMCSSWLLVLCNDVIVGPPGVDLIDHIVLRTTVLTSRFEDWQPQRQRSVQRQKLPHERTTS